MFAKDTPFTQSQQFKLAKSDKETV